MKKAVQIFLQDINRLRVNIIAIIVILGICILPSLYAWFNIAACWDPYGNTGDIPVAVVNQDEGATFDGVDFKIGKEIINTLAGNKQMGWEFVSYKEAQKGIKTGKYYAAVVVPKNFSKDIISISTGDITRPHINYYVNEKKNGIAPKITDKGIEAIQTQVNESFIGSVTKMLTNFLEVGSKKIQLTEEDLLHDVNTTLQTAKSDLTELNDTLDSYINSITAAVNLIDANNSVLDGTSGSIRNAKTTLTNSLNKLNEFEKKVDKTKFPDVIRALDSSESVLTNAIGFLGDFNTSVSSTKTTLSSVKASLQATISSIKSTKKLVSTSITKINNTENDLSKLNTSTNLIKILNKISSEPDQVVDFMTSPVEVNTTAVYPVKNYGSAMAPFYTTLAIWVGGIILVAIMKVRVRKEGELKDLSLRQAYLGRSIIFIIMSLIQSTVLGLGDLLFLEIQCEHPFMFMVTCWITSLVFVLLIYTLTVSFGSIGKALCVIWLVIQVAGSGGTFPLEVLPEAFKSWAPFMPFTYSCNAMRECVAGIYNTGYVTDLLKLVAFIPVALLLGLVLRNPLYRLNEFFEERLEDTKFMG